MTIVYIILAILIFSFLIAIHELGHFAAAKLCHVKVNEFSIGMGPALFQIQRGETQYSLRLIPFGGFCAMEGEDEESDDGRAFTNQHPLKRLMILVAGAFNNFVAGFLTVLILFSGCYAFLTPRIAQFREGCPYNSPDGLQVGDLFLRIDGKTVYDYSEVSEFLDSGDVHDIVLLRDGHRVKLKDYTIVRTAYEGEEKLYYGFSFGYEEATFSSVLRNSWQTTMEFVRLVWTGLDEMFQGNVNMDDVSGPVGIVDMMAETGDNAETVSDGLFDLFYFGAFIAVNLAVMNLLPIPAVDGGRIFSLLVTWGIESVTHRKLDPKYEGWIHTAGLVILLALMAVIMFNDILKLFRT